MYQNYVFDLYGTLVDINTNERKMSLWVKMVELYSFYGAKYNPKEMKKEFERICSEEEKKLKKFDYPEMKIEKTFKKLFENKGIKLDMKTYILVGQFFRIYSTKYIKLYDGAIEFLEELKKKDKKIYLLSNAQQIFTEYEMKHLGIYDYFDGICFSSNESCKKPSSTFYGILFDRYNLKKEESVMIGNDWISDIRGAKDFGIDSVYLHTNISPWDTVLEEVEADIIIEDGDLYKLFDIVK